GAVGGDWTEANAGRVGFLVRKARELPMIGADIGIGISVLEFEPDFVVFHRLYGRGYAGAGVHGRVERPRAAYAIVEVIEVNARIEASVHAHVAEYLVVDTGGERRFGLVVVFVVPSAVADRHRIVIEIERGSELLVAPVAGTLMSVDVLETRARIEYELVPFLGIGQINGA